MPTRQRRRTVPRKSIFLWHEVVHQRFNESLHFYLLGIQNYKLTTLSQIASDLQGFGIAGYCLYEIYGPYDVFMRVWLNRDTKVRLDQWLAETGYLRNYASFQVLQQRHWAESRLADRNEAIALLEHIEPGLIKDAQNDIPEAIQRVVSDRLALEAEVSNAESIKFYTLVVPAALPHSETLNLVAELLSQELSQANQIIKNGSLYFGAGFSWAVMKGMFLQKDYYDFGGFIVRLGNLLSAFQLGLFTFFVANWDSPESDLITEGSIISATVIDQEMDDWIPGFYASQASQEAKNLIHGFVVRRGYLREWRPDDRELVQEMLLAKFGDIQDRYIQELAGWFIKTEARLRRFVGQLPVALGISAERVAQLRKLIRDQSQESTLGALFRLVVLLLEEQKPGGSEEFVTSTFNESSKRVADLRNRVMHGDFDLVFGQTWLARLEELVDFLPVYRRLELLLDRLCTGESSES